MTTQRDYYEVLGVDRNATAEEIKRAYRKAAMKHHPDRNPGDQAAEVKFKECAESFDVLNDPEKRQRYDRFGHAGVRGTGAHDFSHMDASDIASMFEEFFGEMGFGSIFGGGRGGRRGGPRRGYDLEAAVEVDFAEVLTGAKRHIAFTRRDLCGGCSGTGVEPGSTPETCKTCGGQGKVAIRQGFFQMVRPCPDCQGQGRIIKDKCPDCRGTGQRPLDRKIEIKVPPGIAHGNVIRVTGEGEPGPNGGPRGDLHVVVSVKPHKLFERHEDDLVLHMPISFSQAALGGKVPVPTLDGDAELTIERGTQHGNTSVLRGKGLPNLRSGRRGDLVVQCLIEIPKKLSARQEELLREFSDTEDRSILPHSQGFWDKIKSVLGKE